MNPLACARRELLLLLVALPVLAHQDPAGDWSCPMDAGVHLNHPGKCPLCGMTLVLKVPEHIEYPLAVTSVPKLLLPGKAARLTLRVIDPSGHPVTHFEIVHEKLVHLFVVSEDLEFFAHVHPEIQSDGSFEMTIIFPKPGLYRLLADYYPFGSTPQLTPAALYVKGVSRPAHLVPSLTPQRAGNLTAALRLEADPLIVGLESRLYYDLEPSEGLERYLGAWGHLLVASEDVIDLMHLHPFLINNSTIQYNVIFPRPGNYKIWSQFQRLGVVNTVVFSVKVNEI